MVNQNFKILIIDDFPTMREKIISLLEPHGFDRFIEASNGEEAYRQMELNSDTNIVICDFSMPTMDGEELRLKMRSTAAMSTVPFLMLTSRRSGPCDFLNEDPFSDVIQRPVAPRELLEKIKSFQELFAKTSLA